MHFTCRSGREPSIVAMLEDACALAGRHGILNGNESSDRCVSHEDLVAGDGSTLVVDHHIDDEPHVASSKSVPRSHTAAP